MTSVTAISRTQDRIRKSLPLIILAVSLGFTLTASACEPVIPFVEVMSGPGLVTHSLIGLIAAITFKSVAFGWFQKRLSFGRGMVYMVAGNLLSTILGFIAGALIGSSGGMWLIAFPIVFALCFFPARRLTRGSPYKWLSKLPPEYLAAVMTFMLFASCILFASAGEGFGNGRKWEYWVAKLVAVYLALLVSICLTSFWEEWVIWKLSKAKEAEFVFVKPVLRANLLVLLCFMGVAAAIVLPKRLKSPDLLIRPSAARKVHVINN